MFRSFSTFFFLLHVSVIPKFILPGQVFYLLQEAFICELPVVLKFQDDFSRVFMSPCEEMMHISPKSYVSTDFFYEW